MMQSNSNVILNVVKNLKTSTSAFQILRDAQDDKSGDSIKQKIEIKPQYSTNISYICLLNH